MIFGKMISKNVYKYCCEDISLIENYEEAISSEEMYVCHHRRETDEGYFLYELKELDLYYHRPANELIFLSDSEHKKLHGDNMLEEQKKNIGLAGKGRKHSEETKRKIGEANRLALKGNIPWNKGKKGVQTPWNKGIPMSKETRDKLSKACKGMPCPTKGKHRYHDPITGKIYYE